MIKKLIVANWKCNPTDSNSAENIFNSVAKKIKKNQNTEVIICPPFVYLSKLKAKNKTKKTVYFGAQDCFWEERGAFTGEISPLMLKNLGCNYVILGHSERRKYMKETDEIILKKIKKSLKVGLRPIFCIGERKNEKEEGITFDVLRGQLKNVIGELPKNKLLNITVAYEPVWSIGTGDSCPPNEAMSVLMFIKKELLKMFPKNIVDRVAILYGGSVNDKNAKDYIDGGFDGLLIGGVSLRANEFVKIVKYFSEIDGKDQKKKSCKKM